MDQNHILALLKRVSQGEIAPQDALLALKMEPFEDLGYAKVDHHRGLRSGVPEVIFGSGKTAQQMIGIITALKERGEHNVLITRLSPENAQAVNAKLPIEYDPVSRVGIYGRKNELTASGLIVVATGGTSDIPVAEEAAVVSEALGNHVQRLYDVGGRGAAPAAFES